MSRDMQPLFWRINEQDRHGLEAISLLMPTDESSNAALEMPTNIKLYSAGRQAYPMDLRWSEEDQDLFMCLLERVAGRELEGDIQLDLSDDNIWHLIQLVALSRFKTPLSIEQLLGPDINCERTEVSVGDMVAINALYGYPLAVIVASDSIDITCVLLEDLVHQAETILPQYSLLVVNRKSALPAAFAQTATCEQAVLH